MLLAVAVTVVTGWVDWVAVGAWARPRAVLLGLWLLGGLLLVGAGYSWWSARRPGPARRGVRRSPPLSWWAVGVAALVIAGVVWGATTWLLGKAAGNPAAEVEAIKTGLGIGAGTAGVFALLLAVRRQWHQEITAADTSFDATERRVTDLYTKAADQLGSEKAPVRLAGLYALERLAQDNPSQRQTIVNVLCAYLRMPYTLPGDPPADEAEVHATYRERVQEREVRLAAQGILAHHLRPGLFARSLETFWVDIDLDLTGATLIDFSLHGCAVATATFDGATFTGDAWFRGATFTGNAGFRRASFAYYAEFDETTFTGDAGFGGATFAGDAGFGEATFTGDAEFHRATFTGDAGFDMATFTAYAKFTGATFARKAIFNGATFMSSAWFGWVTFRHAWFAGTTFTSGVLFNKATFAGNVLFDRAIFDGDAHFGLANFTGDAEFDGATFDGNAEFVGATRKGLAFDPTTHAALPPDEAPPGLEGGAP